MTDGVIASDRQGETSAAKNEVEKSNKGKKFIDEVTPLDVVGVLGFGFYLAEFYLLMSNRVIPDMSVLNGTALELVFVFLLGEIVSSVLLVAIARFLTTPSAARLAAIFAGALFTMPGIVSLFPLPPIVFVAAWFAAGVGAVVILALWGYFMAKLNHSKAITYSACSVLLAGITLGIVALLFKDEALPFANIVPPIASALLFFVWINEETKYEEFPTYDKVRPYDAKSLLHSAAAMVANSFLIGYGFYVLSAHNSMLCAAAIVLAIILAAVFKLIDSLHHPKYQVSTIISVIAPVAAIEVLLVPYVAEPVAMLIFFAAMLVAMIDEVICWSAVANYMHIYQVHPFANAGFGRFGDIVGLLLGYAYALGSLNEPYDDYLFGLIRGLVIILFVSVQVFFFQDNYKPFTEHSSMNDELSDEAVAAAEEAHKIGTWKKNVSDFARHYDLTGRQTEVLMLLAKGYSTSKIEETLVVSNHTVKAHVYGIYQKVDVHSRQELIELIERFSSEHEA